MTAGWSTPARSRMCRAGRRRIGRTRSWLAKVAERGMCRPSLVQPPEIRRLRDLTRYRRALVQDRTREQQRVEKLLEDAQIKISAVLSNLHGVTGRAIMDALIAGRARSAHAGRAGQGQRTQEDRPARRGAARVLHRAPRDDPADDARQQRPHQRPDRRHSTPASRRRSALSPDRRPDSLTSPA